MKKNYTLVLWHLLKFVYVREHTDISIDAGVHSCSTQPYVCPCTCSCYIFNAFFSI